jgi:hypothetical protein
MDAPRSGRSLLAYPPVGLRRSAYDGYLYRWNALWDSTHHVDDAGG